MSGIKIVKFLALHKLLSLFLNVPGVLAAGVLTISDNARSELMEQGKSLFGHFCVHCLGIGGEGDGFNAEYLDKDPADFTDSDFMAKKSDERLFRVIQKGGPEVKKSFLMPPFGYTLSEEEIWSLIIYIRSFSGGQVGIPPSMQKLRPKTPVLKPKHIKALVEAGFRNPGLIDQGERLFRKKKACFACHQIEEEGGQIGPDLTQAGWMYPPEWLYVWLNDPQSIKPHTKMVNLGLKGDESQAVVSYLMSQTGEGGNPEAWQPYIEEKGDPEQGKKLFFDSNGKAHCGRCHQVQGEGGELGPNLSFIGSARKQNFLLESILKPSEVITKGYATLLILTKNGKFLNGLKKSEDETSLDLVDKDGKILHVPKDIIKKYKTQKISMMPGNFGDLLSVQEIKDLLAFCQSLSLPLLAKFN